MMMMMMMMRMMMTIRKRLAGRDAAVEAQMVLEDLLPRSTIIIMTITIMTIIIITIIIIIIIIMVITLKMMIAVQLEPCGIFEQ